MTRREPELELLLRGGDLIALTELDYEGQRERMRAVLRQQLPQYTRRDPADPGLALIDALAACLDVMGFYHDRIVTESKLGSAQLLESVARLGAAVGYRPLPPIAASAKQFFEAVGPGTVLAGTRVGGPGAVFATTSAIEIAPAVNRMALSPVLTLQAGALRAVIQRLVPDAKRPALAVLSEIAEQQQSAPASLPTDEFRSGMMAMLDSEHGLELATIAASRRRGVGFARALLRSHDDSTTLARATRARHLRFAQALDDSLVVFEVSELPILHLPDPAAPDRVTSTLEVFVFDEPPRSPEDWDAGAAWTEVADFSASKASDRHYRTFVDDRLTTYLILRRKLGYRTLIDDDRLGRVYARYTPAIGRVVDPPLVPVREPPDLDGVTLRLDGDYLTTSLVRPKLEGVAGLHNDARWAVTKDDMGLAPGAQIAILGGASGATYVRTLRDVGERYLAWGKLPVEPRQIGRPANEFDPIDDRFDPAKGKIAPLADIAGGQLYPLWEAYYKQAKARDQLWLPGPAEGTEIPAYTAKGVPEAQLATAIEQIVYLPKGSTFLLLDDASHVKVGDYLLVGRRLTGAMQNREPRKPKQDDAQNAGDPAKPDSQAAIDNQEAVNGKQAWFDTNQPWLTGEVTQALEVQGDLVRIKDPIAQDYYQDRLTSSDQPITEVIVVPRVASVYYGDLFSQRVKLTGKRTFIKINPALTSNYVEVALDTAIDPVVLRSDLELPDNLDLRTKFSRLFLAVEGKLGEPPTSPAPVAWSFVLTLPARGLAPEHVAGVQIQSTVLAASEPPSGNATGGVEIAISSAKDAIAATQHADKILLLAKQDDAALAWTEQGAPGAVLTQGQFRAAALAGWCLRPDDLAAHESLLVAGGTLLIWAGGPEPQAFAFAWQSPPPMLRLTEVDPSEPRPVDNVKLDAVAIPRAHTLDIALAGWTADWRLPDGLFQNAADWMSSPDGVLEIRYASSFRQLDVTIVDDGSDPHIEARDAALQSPLDPLDGASQLWALPTRDLVVITASLVTAIWRFPVGDDVETAAPAGWTGPLVVTGAGKILHSATLEGPPVSHALTAKLDGDATHDLQSSGAIHALLPDEAQAVTPVEIWRWTGKSPFGETSPPGAAALAFDGDPVVVLADIWQSNQALRLIPRGAMASGTNVAAIVKYHATAVNVQVRTTEGTGTQITFTLPPDWPSGVTVTTVDKLVTQNTGQASQILDLVDKPSSVVGDPGEATFRMKVPGGVTDEAIAIYLVVEGSSSGSVSTRSALHLVQPAWDSWVPGPGLGLFFLPAPIGGEAVSDVPSGAERVAVIGTRRSDGWWFVRGGSDAPFPTSGHVYLSPYTASSVAAHPATALRLGTLPADKARLGVLGIRDAQDHWDAYPLALGQLTSGGQVELAKAAPAVFPGGLANTAARFAYEVATYPGDPASTGLGLHTANPAAVANTHGTNTAVFHTAGFAKAVRGELSTDGQNTRVHIAIDPKVIFDPTASPRFPRVSLGSGWNDLAADRLSEGSLILELGPPAKLPLDLAAGDELTLLDGNANATTAKIIAVTDAGAYQLMLQDAPAAVRLHGLVAPLEKLQVKVSFPRPDVLQEPWLLTFQRPGDALHGGGIADTLLFHDAAHLGADDRFSFTLIGTDMLDAIAGNQALHYYTNEVSQLHRDLYDGSLVGLSGTNNFLKSSATGDIEVLLAAVNAADFPTGTGPGPHVLLCSKSRAKPLAKGDGYFESGTAGRALKDITIPVLSQSIVFPSGDFIPVTGTLQDRDDKIIRNALRVWLLDQDTKQDSRLVIYEPRLTKIVELFDANNSWQDVRTKLGQEQPPIDGLDHAVPSLLLYSFNKALGGAFTLNFLLIDAALEEHKPQEVRVYVEYSADRLPDDPADPDGRIYQFETRLLRLDPKAQLVVIDKGELKPDDYLFLHTAQQEIIQWTRVQSVTGVVIGVDPPVPFEIDSFRSYALRGFAKPPRPTALDKDYYTQVKDADLTGEVDPTSPRPLVLADRLVLDPDAGSALLEAIIPGDRLLIWNETYRVAWNHHRVGSSAQDPPWNEWPDYQVEAVVKQVDAATGLVVLAEPLPERFCVAFSLVSHPDLAEAAHPDPEDRPPWYTLEPGALTLRVLPHYRAPFQGKRRMLTLGSGDKSRRFARFTGLLAPDPGLGTLPLPGDGAYASNIEVLALDPRSGDWSRWTELADINQAEKKDRAFTLGVDAAKIGTGQPVPFSASFGDGIQGQLLPTGTRNVFARVTAIGGRTEHVIQRRPLLILEARPNVRVPFEVPPGANAASDNLWLVIETGAPEPWSPAGRRAAWQPAMEIEVPQHGLPRVWREISQDEVCQGWDGFYVHSLRPGVVEVFFFTPEPLEPDLGSVRAWSVPDARLWALDAEFYADLARQDLTRLPGAKHLQLLETDGLAQGSLLALSQHTTGPTEILRIDAVDPDTWSATLVEPIERTYAIGEAFLRGNLVDVVQGDTERVVLGSGDGSSLDLRLAVYSRAPLLHVLAAGHTDPEPAVTVLVDGTPWSRVTELDDAGPRDRVYRVDVEADSSVFVAFGDGVHGAVPGAGNSNIVAVLGTGDGGAGNLAAGAVTKLLDGNLAVKSTANLIDAAGGRRGDTADQAREALLGRSVAFDRIVSLDDVSRVAMEVGEVLHARVDPTAPPEILRLVVALVGRREPTPAVRDAIQSRVTALMPATAGITVQVDGAVQVPVHLAVKVTTGAGYVQGEVLAALRRAFGSAAGGFFAAERCPIAEPLRLGDVYEAIFAVPGVSAALVTWMSTDAPPVSPDQPAPDTLDPGTDGVIRCDSDPRSDPDGERGTVSFTPSSGGPS